MRTSERSSPRNMKLTSDEICEWVVQLANAIPHPSKQIKDAPGRGAKKPRPDKEWSAVWERALSSETIAGVHFDPYLIWMLLTRFRSLDSGRWEPGKVDAILTLAVELHKPYVSPPPPSKNRPAGIARTFYELLTESGKDARVPHVYGEPLANTNTPSRFVTVRISVPDRKSDLDTIITALTKLLLEFILAPDVKRVQLGYPRAKKDPEDHDQSRTIKPTWSGKVNTVIGIIEDSSPFAHHTLRRHNNHEQTRVVWLWDQSSFFESNVAWRPKQNLPYGRTAISTDLNRVMQTSAAQNGGWVTDVDCYQTVYGLDLRHLAVRRSHGAAIAGLAAGYPNPMPQHMNGLRFDEGMPERTESVRDAAAIAPIVWAQLPVEQVQISSGRWLAVHVLDAIRYLTKNARAIVDERSNKPISTDANVVINLSYGGLAGPHDGTGILEAAIDELCNADEKLAVVMAAGNSLRKPKVPDRPFLSGLHLERTIHAGDEATLTLKVPTDKPFETYAEIWFDTEVSAAECTVKVVPPPGLDAFETRAQGLQGVHSTDSFQKGELLAAIIFCKRVAQSLGKNGQRSCAMLVVAATQPSSTRPFAPCGEWQITIQNTRKQGALRCEAWVERDDIQTGMRRGQSARFAIDDPLETDVWQGGTASIATDRNTFTNLANGATTFSVGALQFSTDTVSHYSSEGANDQAGPDFSAYSDISETLPGLRVPGSTMLQTVRMNGTSVAAPQATRWIVNQLDESGRTIQNIRDQLAQNRVGAAPSIPNRSLRGELVTP